MGLSREAPAGADTEDGIACLEAVVAEIGATRFLEAEVREALSDYATHCTPDPALRALPRAPERRELAPQFPEAVGLVPEE